MKTNLILIGAMALIAGFANAVTVETAGAIPVKTYNWIIPDMKTSQNPMYSSAFSRHQIQNAFDAALNSKGLTRNTKNPDLLLQFHTYTQRVRRNYYGGGSPMYMTGWGRFGWGYPYGLYGYNLGQYPYSTTGTDGTIVLDIVDSKTGNIIWQRAISGDVSNPNILTKRINKGVRKLMKAFPAFKV